MSLSPRVESLPVDAERSLRCGLYGDPQASRVLVFDPGSFGIYADAHHLGLELARRGWFCVLTTRAGMYGSDPLPEGESPRPSFHVRDLERLLDRLNLGPRKVVLAGHSMSGVRTHLAGCSVPKRFLGLALLDAACPSLLGGMRWSGWVNWATGLGSLGAKVAGKPIGNLVETLHPNFLKLEGLQRADKLASINSASHLEIAAEEVAVTANRALSHPIEPALHLPAFFATSTPVSHGTSALVEQYEASGTWVKRIRLPKDGHMSMLTPPASGLIADGIEEMWAANGDSP